MQPLIDLDRSLNEMANMPVPAALASIDETVFASLLAYRADSRMGSRLMGAAGLAALAIGIAGGTFAPGPAVAADASSPFASATALAPSTLLD